MEGKRHNRAKLTEQQIQEIRRLESFTQAKLALWYGVSQSTIHRIRSKTSWKYLNIGANPNRTL